MKKMFLQLLNLWKDKKLLTLECKRYTIKKLKSWNPQWDETVKWVKGNLEKKKKRFKNCLTISKM